MTKEDARQRAISLLEEEYPEFKAGDWILSGVEEYDSAWAFSYNTREYVETLDVRHALAGSGTLVIPMSGAEPCSPGQVHGQSGGSRSPRGVTEGPHVPR